MTSFKDYDIQRLQSIVAQRLGLVFDASQLDDLAAALCRRVSRTGAVDAPTYLDQLGSSGVAAAELRELANDLVVQETYFFRHPDHYGAFAEVAVPQCMAGRERHRPLRILSAGCASGEEPYSLAILAREAVVDAANRVQVTGIDVSSTLLAKAAAGRYSEWSLRATAPGQKQKYFRRDGREYVLDESIRAMVSFELRNLVEDDPAFWTADAFDIIFFRNVSIYFAAPTTKQIIARMAGSLEAGGFLFLGPSETLRGVSDEFHLLHTHGTFYYQRRGDGERRPSPATAAASASIIDTLLPAVQDDPDRSWVDQVHLAAQRIEALVGKSTTENTEKTGSTNQLGAGCARNPSCASAPEILSAREETEGLLYESARISEDSCRFVDREPETRGQRTPAPSRVSDLAVAQELLRQERFNEAIAALTALPAESAASADALLLRAAVLTIQGSVAEAERICRQVLASDELNAAAHYLLALCREHAGDRPAAAEEDQTAIYLDGSFAMPHLHLGMMTRRSGDLSTAQRELQQAVGLLQREDAARILLFGGGFTREALLQFCRAELRACGGAP